MYKDAHESIVYNSKNLGKNRKYSPKETIQIIMEHPFSALQSLGKINLANSNV